MHMNWMMTGTYDSMKAFFIRVGNFIPILIGVLLILIIGWILARVLQNLLVKMLQVVGIDNLAQSAHIDDFLHKGDIKHSLSELFGIFLYWLIILATLLAALNALGLTMAAELLDRVIAYVPNVLGGIIVLILGLFFAALVSGTVQTAAANAGIAQAKAMGQIARVVVIVFSVVVALEKFFSSVIIQTTYTIVLAAIAFGLALAFGLGCKDIVGKMTAEFIDKMRRR